MQVKRSYLFVFLSISLIGVQCGLWPQGQTANPTQAPAQPVEATATEAEEIEEATLPPTATATARPTSAPPESRPATGEAAANADSPLGTHVDFLVDWSTELPLVDVFKPSRPWVPLCIPDEQADCDTWWDTGEADLIDVDEDGWVRSLPAAEDAPVFWQVGTLMLRDIGDRYPAGQYIVLYEGEGTLAYDFAASKDEAASRAGRDVINVTPDGDGILLKITETDPKGTGNYIRNIRVIMPGFEENYEAQVFNPEFLAKMAPFRTIRFTDWIFINDEPPGEWSERPLMTDARWSADGAPIELMVALANTLGADAWFTMPHAATDAYVSGFAALVRDTLDGERRVYVEYSNEVWNNDFPQGYWVEAQGQAAWPNAPEDGYTKRLNWYGKRAAEVCELWKGAWGAQAERVTCVLSGQGGVEWTATEALACPLWAEGAPCYGHGIDALAIAPYFGWYIGGEHADEVRIWANDPDGGLDRLFAELTAGTGLTDDPPRGALGEAFDAMSQAASIAEQYGLDLVAYEGGQHLVLGGWEGMWDDEDPLIDMFQAANRDPRMGDLYRWYLEEWKAAGGGLFVHYKNTSRASRWGSFGALEYIAQEGSPKYDALMGFIEDNPCWWTGCSPGD